MIFKDYFSKQSGLYAKARPHYPPTLFDFLNEIVSSHDTAWDCATGNGQAALALAPFFKNVIATDASDEQLKNAFQKENVQYRKALAEDSGITSHSIDLITVATAAHWFKLEKFYDEVKRVIKPGGVLALWTYSSAKTSSPVHEIISQLEHQTLKEYWPKDRCNVWNKYEDLYFPFQEIIAPNFFCKEQWSLIQVTDYLNTWSATQQYIKLHNTNPIETIFPELQKAWGDLLATKEITWELGIRVARI